LVLASPSVKAALGHLNDTSLKAETDEVLCDGIVCEKLPSGFERLSGGEESAVAIVDLLLDGRGREKQFVVGDETILPVALVVADVVFANEATEFQERSSHTHHVEGLVELNLWAILGIHKLNNIEAFWLSEPAHVVPGDKELVLAIRGSDESTEEVNFVLSNEPPGSEGILALLALLGCLLTLVNCSLSSGLPPGCELLLSCGGSCLVLLARELLLFLEFLLA